MANSPVSDQRLFNQHIDGKKFEKPEEVVRWMSAVQAQSYPQSLWAIGQRMHSATVADIEKATADGKILRTWPMRGTIHFVPPEDAQWMLKLSAPRILAKFKRRHEELGLNEETLEHHRQPFYDTLKGGKQLSRPNMINLLEESGISTQDQRGYHILLYASLTGLICIGPMEGKQPSCLLGRKPINGIQIRWYQLKSSWQAAIWSNSISFLVAFIKFLLKMQILSDSLINHHFKKAIS